MLGLGILHLAELVGRILEVGAFIYLRPDVRRYIGLPDGTPPRGTGLPIGSVLSQVLASHLVLAELDHRITRTWKVPGYLRYVDDLVLFGPTRSALEHRRDEIAAWLWNERSLRLKHPLAVTRSCRGHLDVLGFRIRREGVAPLPRATVRMRRRAASRIVAGGRVMSAEKAGRGIAASAGLLMFGSEVGDGA